MSKSIFNMLKGGRASCLLWLVVLFDAGVWASNVTGHVSAFGVSSWFPASRSMRVSPAIGYALVMPDGTSLKFMRTRDYWADASNQTSGSIPIGEVAFSSAQRTWGLAAPAVSRYSVRTYADWEPTATPAQRAAFDPGSDAFIAATWGEGPAANLLRSGRTTSFSVNVGCALHDLVILVLIAAALVAPVTGIRRAILRQQDARRRELLLQLRCPRCLYDVSASEGPCPECGEDPAQYRGTCRDLPEASRAAFAPGTYDRS